MKHVDLTTQFCISEQKVQLIKSSKFPDIFGLPFVSGMSSGVSC